jgi:hypothetical protein
MTDTSTLGTTAPTDAPASHAVALDAVVPGRWDQRAWRRLVPVLRPHWQFGLVLLAAAALRLIVILGYPPVLWFNDSYNYLIDAVALTPDVVRPDGYPFLLALVHSLTLVSVLQALMGVGMGTAIYAVLRHRGLPWQASVLPALPVLFDVFELHLEHMIAADTLFIFLVTMALVICCWSDRPPVAAVAVAGLLIGYATLVRSVGEPLLAVFVLGMLARRAGWQRMAALIVAAVVPVAAYAVWFHSFEGKYALTEASGDFLYSRVSTFAECKAMDPPASLRVLCDPTPPSARPPAEDYLWADYEDAPYVDQPTPLAALTGNNNEYRFTKKIDSLTMRFAERAILAQPLAYLRVVADDTLHTFGWARQPDPHDYTGNGPDFRFVSQSALDSHIPWWTGNVPGDVQAVQMYQARRDFGGARLGDTRTVQPWARLIQRYQGFGYLPGTLLGLIVIVGGAGLLARRRRWGGVALLPWLTGVLLIVLPPMTAGFSYRYVLAAVPAACLAFGLTFALQPGDGGRRALTWAPISTYLTEHALLKARRRPKELLPLEIDFTRCKICSS